MITKEIKARYSCPRKRDFMTGFAIIFFFIIVALELYLILWVPIQLQREGVLQKHVAKEKMGNKIDHYRSVLRSIKPSGSLRKGEIDLARDMLDMYANYVREHQDKLELAEILEISSLLDRYGALAIRWKRGDFAFRRNEIPLQRAMEIIEKKNGL